MLFDGLLINSLTSIGNSTLTVVPAVLRVSRRDAHFCFLKLRTVPKGLNGSTRSWLGSLRDVYKRQEGGVWQITS